MKLLLPGVDALVRCPKTKRAAPCERGLMRGLRMADARFAGPADAGPELLLHMAAEMSPRSPDSGQDANTKTIKEKNIGVSNLPSSVAPLSVMPVSTGHYVR